MKVIKQGSVVGGVLKAELDEIDNEYKACALGVEIEMRQASINKMGAILAKAKDTVREAQRRIDYEKMRLDVAANELRELRDDR